MNPLASRSRRLAVLGAACALTVAACGDGSGGDTSERADTSAPPTTVAPEAEPTVEPGADVESAPTDDPAAAPADAPAILQFTAPLVGGGEIDAAATAGSPTVFWFWAPT